MGYKVSWQDQAKAELRAIDQATAMRILHALALYAATNQGDVKKLKGVEPAENRLRVGDYRVRFHRQEGTIVVTAVGHRRDIYR